MAFLKTLEVMILHFNQRSIFYNEISSPELSLRNVLFLTSLRIIYFSVAWPLAGLALALAATVGCITILDYVVLELL